MSDHELDEKIDRELRSLGRTIDRSLTSSPSFVTSREEAVQNAVLAFQQARQQQSRNALDWSWVLRLAFAATATAALTLVLAKQPERYSGQRTWNDGAQSFDFSEITLGLSDFSENFSADFLTSELEADAGVEVFNLGDLEAGLTNDTTWEDFDNEFDAAKA